MTRVVFGLISKNYTQVQTRLRYLILIFSKIYGIEVVKKIMKIEKRSRKKSKKIVSLFLLRKTLRKEMSSQLQQWIKESKLSKYENVLMDEIGEMEVVQILTEEDVNEIAKKAKMGVGHRRIFLRAIAKVKKGEENVGKMRRVRRNHKKYWKGGSEES